MAAKDDIANAAIMDRLMKDLQRAAALGLIPQDGAKISAQGEFIIDPSNIEDDENKKMRSYRHKAYPSTVHAWPEGHAEPISLVVKNRAEEEAAVAQGWSVDPVAGPGGRLENGKAPAEPDEEPEVRSFAPPGQVQPFEKAPEAPKAAAKAKTRKKKR